jgi:hypothetical protein
METFRLCDIGLNESLTLKFKRFQNRRIMKNLEHPAYALLFMAIIGLLTGNWFAGACFGSAFFVGREHAQAEYRVIQKFYDGKRANMPWYGGFESRGWDIKSILDFGLPIIVTTIALLIIKFTGLK